MGADNPYNPFGSGPGRLSGPEFDEAMEGVSENGMDLIIDNYRFGQVPRIVDNDGTMNRFLQGFRGTSGDWDWEALSPMPMQPRRTSLAIVFPIRWRPRRCRFFDGAFNPFDPTYEGSNIERILVDVYRKSETRLTTLDAKFSNAAGPARGSVAGLVGAEWRKEKYAMRDPRLDGTIVFMTIRVIPTPT